MSQDLRGLLGNTTKNRAYPRYLSGSRVTLGLALALILWLLTQADATATQGATLLAGVAILAASVFSMTPAIGRFPGVHNISAAAPLTMSLALLFASPPLLAGDITSKMQTNIDRYKKQAVTWAADPLVVKAVKDANEQGAIQGMGNAKWRELKDTDPVVQGFVTNPTGQLLTKWMETDAKGINKIVLSGAKSQRVGFTSMPAIYLGKGKPNFDEAMDGKVWQQGETNPYPSTTIDSVQIAAPVKDGDEVIGVLLISLTAGSLNK